MSGNQQTERCNGCGMEFPSDQLIDCEDEMGPNCLCRACATGYGPDGKDRLTDEQRLQHEQMFGKANKE